MEAFPPVEPIILPVIALPPCVQCRDKRMLVFIGLPTKFLDTHVYTKAIRLKTVFGSNKMTRKFNRLFKCKYDPNMEWMVGFHLMERGESGEWVWDITFDGVMDSCVQAVQNSGRCDLLMNEGCVKTISPAEFGESISDWQLHFVNVLRNDESFHFCLTEQHQTVSTSDQPFEKASNETVQELMRFVCE
jgi:hypothetical protein